MDFSREFGLAPTTLGAFLKMRSVEVDHLSKC